MIFYNPDQEGENGDDWKKEAEQNEKHAKAKKTPMPDVYKKYAFGHPISFALADQLAVRFTELGFDPDTIYDKEMFGILFIGQGNCLLIKRGKKESGKKFYVSGHWFLERKKNK